ncbi:hypothetical protein HMN09_01400000 [Mycena chlorophos]|uniref:F-box domain-containing protein n=1 Tax=Mycena chlorophos TaxID=658473 RepID=A0A8H6RXU7_MYCCL|nr:hypothetical protein HMN09_01400000 [Mycena chlorophos]
MDSDSSLLRNDFYDVLVRLTAPDFTESQVKPTLDAANAELAQLDTQIADLTFARNRQGRRVAAIHYAMSPLRMVPSEVLTQIFRATIDARMRKLTQRSNQNFKNILRLASVCSHWRQVVISDPRMWTLPLRVNLSKRSTSYAEMVGLMIQRSSPHGVQFFLVATQKKRISPSLFAAVMHCVERWERIKITFNILPLLQSCSSSPKILRFADICLPPSSKGPSSTFFANAAGLKNVKLPMQDLAELPMPLAQLTRLRLYRCRKASSLLRTLSQCHALQRLTLDTTGWKSAMQSSTVVVTLPRLLAFQLEVRQDNDDDEVLTRLFENCTFSALRELCIKAEIECSAPLGPAFPSFLSRCPKLLELEIAHTIDDSGALEAMLPHLPALRTLRICCCSDCTHLSFVERFIYRESESAHCAPCLTNVILDFSQAQYEGLDFGGEAVHSLVRARWWVDAERADFITPPRVARWKCIEVLTLQEELVIVSAGLDSVIRECRKQGLKVKFEYRVEEDEDSESEL